MLNVLHCAEIVNDIDLWWSTVLKSCCVDKDNFLAICVLCFWDKDTGLFCTWYATWADFELFRKLRILCFILFTIFIFYNFSKFNSSHLEEKSCLPYTWNTSNQYPILVFNLLQLLCNLFFRSVYFMDIQYLDLFSYSSP